MPGPTLKQNPYPMERPVVQDGCKMKFRIKSDHNLVTVIAAWSAHQTRLVPSQGFEAAVAGVARNERSGSRKLRRLRLHAPVVTMMCDLVCCECTVEVGGRRDVANRLLYGPRDFIFAGRWPLPRSQFD